jgi:N-acetylneuraminic acid mutarotase
VRLHFETKSGAVVDRFVVRFMALGVVAILCLAGLEASAQSFSTSNLDFDGLGSISSGTSLEFGPDGRLYVAQLNGTLDVFTIMRQGVDDYVVIEAEEILAVKNVPNHDDDGSSDSNGNREMTGIAVAGTATNPIVYATSSDSRIGGPSGDKDLDTNSGVITRLAWQGSDLDDPSGFWEAVDMVRGLPRSEENHATNGLEVVSIGANDYLIVCSGGHTNAGSPSTNFAWSTEYALSAAVLAVNLTQLEAMPILNDGTRDYIYDLPTLDDPTRANANGITDPSAPGYDGIDVNDPFGGNDGLNQAKIVPGGPVQILSPGYRNTYDLVVTESGAVYVTDNGANSGWGGFPDNEGLGGNTTNDYRPGEPGSSGSDNGEAQVNNQDHLSLVTTDLSTYVFGSFYGGHPNPVRSNPSGAGLFTRGTHSSDPGDSNGNGYTDDWFRTVPFDPNGSGEATDPAQALPADWPPVPLGLANPVEGDFRNPGGSNPDGPNDVIVTTWQNNSNGIDEYTASNFGGAMQGDLIVGRSSGSLHRVELLPDGTLDTLTPNWVSGIGGNALGVTANGDSDPFPGTIWVATFSSDIVVLEPQDFVICIEPGDPGYDPGADNDFDGYTNQDEADNGTDLCNGGSQPGDFDKAAGAPLVSDLNDVDDDDDAIDDAADPMQLGNPADGGLDSFDLPVINELFSGNPTLQGYLGLGFTGVMNNGDPNPNWLDWLDVIDAGPNPNDILGGAIGAMTMQMTEGSAYGPTNDQVKAFQYGVNVDLSTVGFVIQGRLLNFDAGFQLYPFGGNAELGIFLGDGSQSDFIQMVVWADGVEMLQEIGDVPQAPVSAVIEVVDRPTMSLEFDLEVESATGIVEAFVGIDGGPRSSIGNVVAQGPILTAIQDSGTPLMVGLIGSSHAASSEVEGTWDYLNVIGRVPSVSVPLPDLNETVGASPVVIDLDAHFDDDGGVGNLSYTLESASNPDIGASLVGTLLTLTFPAFAATTVITVRATDGDGFFVEQTFTVEATDPLAIYRINTGGSQISAIDGGIPWDEDTTGNNSPYLTNSGGNNQAGFSMSSYTPLVDQATTPLSIFNTERWSSTPGNPSMTYSFPVSQPGTYEIRLYMGNGWSGANDPGERVFSVELEEMVFADLTDLDLTATFGHEVGGVVIHAVEVLDGTLEIDFFHGSANNPMLNGIEILSGVGGGGGSVPISVTPIGNQANLEGDTLSLPVLASGGDTPGSFAFSATGLPSGLQIEPTTGSIFGTISVGATSGSPYAVTVTVDDTDADPSDTVDVNFSWTISDPLAPVWIDLDEDESYTARHECSFVQAGDRFYLFGGRESAQTLDTYDFGSDTWTTSASAPIPFNHFQATEHQGLIWVIGAFETNSFPTEDPADDVWIFDPANDVWIQGPSIPAARRRGSAGLVVYDDKFYVVAGNTIGHDGGYVSWFDEFDPETGVWTPLTDAPRARDHFHAAVIGDKLYVAGGRLSGGPGGTFAPLIAEVDVYDFTTSTWSTLPATSNLPTPRAASATAAFQGELIIAGGEGNGQAYDTVEALDPVSGQWRTLASLNHARHGTQAIVSGAGLYVIAGSPNQGGGNQKNLEVYNANMPNGPASVAGVLSAPIDVDLVQATPQLIALDHVSGNEGIYIESVLLSGVDAVDFDINTPIADPFLIPISASFGVTVEYTGISVGATANLDITYSGGATTSVELNAVPEPNVMSGLVAGAALLYALQRRRKEGNEEGDVG